MRTELTLTALEMALGRQNLSKEKLVSHSDRGSQYASEEYRNKLAEFGISASMYRKANCWDNAYAESFFAVSVHGVAGSLEKNSTNYAKKS